MVKLLKFKQYSKRIQVFWDVTLCCWINGSWPQCVHYQRSRTFTSFRVMEP